ncbi:nucleoside deaminase [Terribacillus saccharophilus]|uniref:nucleoside deaminase n=1 Tax=Terribacillus saccharophilus TaxID=361277 RepID=UPI003982B5FB
MDHHYYIDYACKLAVANVNSGKGGPFGAVIVKDGKIVGEGTNLVTSLHDPTAHAEIQAIRNATSNLDHFELEDCIIYSSCEPCPMCLGAIYWARPKALYFAYTKKDAAAIGFDDDFIYQEIEKPYEERKIYTVQLRDDQTADPMKAWTEKEDKVEY